MLAENIRWVEVSRDEAEVHRLRRHCFARDVVGQSMVAHLQEGVWNGAAFDH